MAAARARLLRQKGVGVAKPAEGCPAGRLEALGHGRYHLQWIDPAGENQAGPTNRMSEPTTPHTKGEGPPSTAPTPEAKRQESIEAFLGSMDETESMPLTG